MKGQSLIVQFILFFLVGLSVFLSLGNFFRLQLDVFGGTISEKSRELLSSFVTANFISLNSCVACDTANSTLRVQNPQNVFLEVLLDSDSLDVISQPDAKVTTSTMHNLLLSFVSGSGRAVAIQPIILSLIKTQNILRVAG